MSQKAQKHGPKKLLDLLNESSSPSAKGSQKAKKLNKVLVGEATPGAQLKRRAVMGVISDIAGSLITLVHQIQRDRLYKVTVNDQTIYSIKGIATGSASLSDLAIGQRIAAVGQLVEGGGILAKRIHVIPGKATGIFSRFPVATPSATPNQIATPSASPSSTPSATLSPTSTLTPTPTY